jgi:MoxR-like ATPase
LALGNAIPAEQRLADREQAYIEKHGAEAIKPKSPEADLAENLVAGRGEDAESQIEAGFQDVAHKADIISAAVQQHRKLIAGFAQNTREKKLLGDPRRAIEAGLMREELAEVKALLDDLTGSSIEAYYYLHAMDLIEMSRDYRESGGRLVYAPFVVETMDELSDRLENGRVAFLHGETGTGKTEIAREAARRYTGGKEPELVRCHNDMDSSELTGHLALVAANQGISVSEMKQQIEAEVAQYIEQNPVASDEGKADVKNLATQAVLSGSTVTKYIMGPIYRAADEGNVVILDEANYIPPGILANLNDIMTKRPGDTIPVQEDGIAPITVQDGFGIILTGNIGDKYEGGRHEFDFAAVNRLTTVLYDYLPQTKEGKMADAAPEQKQLFMTMLTGLMDESGRIVAQSGDLERIWNLAKLARLTQESFAGKLRINNMPVGGAESNEIQLANALTNRDLLMLLKDYTFGLHKEKPKTLDELLYDQLIKGTLDDDQQRELYFQAQLMDFFREGDGWAKLNTANEETFYAFRPAKSRDKGLKDPQIEVITIRDIVDAIYRTSDSLPPTNFAYVGETTDGAVPEGDGAASEAEQEATATEIKNMITELQGRQAMVGSDVPELAEQLSILQAALQQLEETGTLPE